MKDMLFSVFLILGHWGWGADLSCHHLFLKESSLYSLQALEFKILQLQPYQKISKSLYNYYTVNQVAKSLIHRLHQQEVDLKASEHEVITDLSKNSEIIIFFRPEDFSSIHEQGFLNQHQIQKSNGFFTPKLRKRVENTLADLDLGYSDLALQLRPKFAFLNLTEPVEFNKKEYAVDTDYGRIAAVLKQEIKQRATWTSSDSNWLIMHGIGYEKDSSIVKQHLGTFSRGSFPKDGIDNSYNEAQIWGSLDVTDVDYFLISQLDDLVRLKPVGKPIYRRVKQHVYGRDIYTKGELLFAGSQ